MRFSIPVFVLCALPTLTYAQFETLYPRHLSTNSMKYVRRAEALLEDFQDSFLARRDLGYGDDDDMLFPRSARNADGAKEFFEGIGNLYGSFGELLVNC